MREKTNSHRSSDFVVVRPSLPAWSGSDVECLTSGVPLTPSHLTMNSSPTPAIDADTPYVRSPEILASDLSEHETILLNVDRGFYYGTEGVGRMVWDALSQPQTLDSLITLVCASYDDVTESQCRADLTLFLGDLLKAELIAPVVDRLGGGSL